MTVFPIKVKFFGNLSNFLPSGRRNKFYTISVFAHQSIKDIIEAEGIPHIETDLIVVNRRFVDFRFKPGPGAIIGVYPLKNRLHSKNALHLILKPLANPRFLLDEHLGKLARLMRMCGFDTYLFSGKSDRELVEMNLRKKRIILTRDIELLKRKEIKRGYWIRNQDPDRQMSEVIRRFDLKTKLKPFHRCLSCNGKIGIVSKKTASSRIPPRTRELFDEFYRCKSCGKIYWKGSHYERMKTKIPKLAGTGMV